MKKTGGKLLIIAGILIFAALTYNDWHGLVFWGNSKDSVRSANASVTEINHIDINAKHLTVKVKAEHRDDIKAELSGNSAHLKSSKQGHTLRLSAQAKGFFSFFQKNQLILRMPYQYKDDLSIRSVSGSVKMTGEHLSLRKLSLNSGSGSVKIDQLYADELSVKGTSGNIRLESIKTKTANIVSTSGNTELDNVTGKLSLKQTSGNLNASFSAINDAVSIDQTSGNTKLELPKDADIKLQATAASGSIKHSYPFNETSGDRRELIGKNGNGKYKIDISLTSGNVSIE
ncbi:DUF4097 domain-containing protein [Bacillus sp. WMMC1349]|uniref:LiaG family protein n=1 Tax=Bacillus sp. WMMC1349 TaxID=2736254 RepID=UPI001557B18F|nr:DUF4097 domain-containing protein [Bacillus sp. WMMC1349]NPC94133.1 DUF4097 domain-containing protein [Bacillus sp. WMMC1349]